MDLQAQVDSYNKDYYLKWFANVLTEKYRKSNLFDAAIVNNTLKTKNFKEKLFAAQSNVSIMNKSNDSLLKDIDYVFYVYDNNLHDHYNKVVNLNNFYN